MNSEEKLMMLESLPEPRIIPAKNMIWKHFFLNDMQHIQSLWDPDEIKTFLRKRLKLEMQFDSDGKIDIFSSLLYSTWKYCESHRFSMMQSSTMLSIVMELHSAIIETPKDNHEEVQILFRDLMLRHSIQKPPYFILVFHPNNVMKIIAFVNRYLMRTIRQMKYIFSLNPALTIDIISQLESNNGRRSKDELDVMNDISLMKIKLHESETPAKNLKELTEEKQEKIKQQTKELISKMFKKSMNDLIDELE
ncbi:hypothetical protein SNEBB_009177 [Seison nebaliae]|nr:hypothetical protein SNEBB_009177 [Seison nebaliae]